MTAGLNDRLPDARRVCPDRENVIGPAARMKDRRKT